MVKCPDCGKDVNRANGCSVCEIEINGEWYEKLKFGTDDDYYHWADEKNRCPDCGAKLGYYHHSGCDMEICPRCDNMSADCICTNFGGKKMLPRRRNRAKYDEYFVTVKPSVTQHARVDVPRRVSRKGEAAIREYIRTMINERDTSGASFDYENADVTITRIG